MKTVWLLDVDGVINANRPGWGAPPRSRHIWAGGQEWRIRWAPALVDRIRAIHAGGLAEIVWCTTWCPDADQLERLWGWPSLGRAFTEQLYGDEAAKAKVAAATKTIHDGHRLIWTDDDETPEPGSPLYEHLTQDGQALLIRPRHSAGLQPEHMDQIEAFVKEA